MEKTNFDFMQEIQVKLEDIQNSQESVVEKMGVIQVELFNHPDKQLEGQMQKMATLASETYEYIHKILEEHKSRMYEMQQG